MYSIEYLFTTIMEQENVKVIEDINDLSIKEIAARVLTNFKSNGNTEEKKSWYFNYCNYFIRVSDHLAKTSNGNIQIVQLDDEHILFWKIGIRLNSTDGKSDEVNGFSKFVTKEELFDILNSINNNAKYFIP